MERTMRRNDRQLPIEECLTLLKKADHGVLSVVGDEGWPYAVPVNYVELDGKLYIHGAAAGYKLEAISRDDRVCFTVIARIEVLPTQITATYESVIVKGRAHLVEEQEERQLVLDRFVDALCQVTPEVHARYVEKFGPKTALIRITPEVITGKAARNPTPIEDRLR